MNDKSNQEKNDGENKNNLPKAFYRSMHISAGLMLSSIFILVFAFYGVLKPEAENTATWFQRSGSLVVVIIVLVEMYLGKLKDYPFMNYGI